MEFRTKKLLCKLSALVIAACSAAAMAISANAGYIIGPITVSNFVSYSNSITGSASIYSAQPSVATLSSTSTDYNGTYKRVGYTVQEELSNGSFKLIASDEDTGTSKTVSANPIFNQYSVTRKYYYGELRKTTSSSSTIKDNYTIDVRKK